MSENSLAKYTPDKYNVLVSVVPQMNLSSLFRVAVQTVQLREDPQEGDVYVLSEAKRGYKKGNRSYPPQPKKIALTKNGLLKLMSAANIQWLKSEKLEPSTGKPEDVAWQATVAVPKLSGGFSYVKGTDEMRYAEITTETGRKFRVEQCETKALLRAIRGALMIKPWYTEEEISKPFVIPIIVPNYDDPDMKKAILERYAKGRDDIYGMEQGMADQGDRVPVDAPEEKAKEIEEPMYFCDLCDALIEPFETPGGDHWSTERIMNFSEKEFQMKLCPACIKIKRQEAGA